VFLSFFMTFGIYAASPWLGHIYARRRGVLMMVAVGVLALVGIVWTASLRIDQSALLGFLESAQREPVAMVVIWACAAAYGVSLYLFSGLFARETVEQKQQVRDFFKKLDTPVDVEKEVYGSGKKQVSVFPLTGATILIMAALLSMVFLTDLHGAEGVFATMIGLFVIIGSAMLFLGRRVS
jgi:hypothetical protein